MSERTQDGNGKGSGDGARTGTGVDTKDEHKIGLRTGAGWEGAK